MVLPAGSLGIRKIFKRSVCNQSSAYTLFPCRLCIEVLQLFCTPEDSSFWSDFATSFISWLFPFSITSLQEHSLWPKSPTSSSIPVFIHSKEPVEHVWSPILVPVSVEFLSQTWKMYTLQTVFTELYYYCYKHNDLRVVFLTWTIFQTTSSILGKWNCHFRKKFPPMAKHPLDMSISTKYSKTFEIFPLHGNGVRVVQFTFEAFCSR